MPVTREGPDLHGLVTVLSAHSVPAKPFMQGYGEAGNGGNRRHTSHRRRRRYPQGSSRRSGRRRTGPGHRNTILRHDSARLSPDARLDAVLRRTTTYRNRVDRQLRRRAPALHAAARAAVLEVTTPDKQDRRRRGKNDDLDAQNAAHAAFAGQRT